jgi:hypothetical protein
VILATASPSTKNKFQSSNQIELRLTSYKLNLLDTNDGSVVILDQTSNASLNQDACAIGMRFSDFFQFLHQSVSDGHTREAFATTMSTRERVATKARNLGEIQLELGLQPFDSGTTVAGKNLNKIGTSKFTSRFHGVLEESVDAILEFE